MKRDDLLERLDEQGLYNKADRIQMIKDAATEIRRLRAATPTAGGDEAATPTVPADCDWPNEPFKFHDEPGEHDPCYVVMPGGAMLALNHHAGEGVDIARAKFIVAACNAALIKGLPPSPMAIEVIVTDAMQDRWNDICADTGCHPLDIKRAGKGQLEFHVSHWARQVGKQVASVLSDGVAQPSLKTAQREED